MWFFFFGVGVPGVVPLSCAYSFYLPFDNLDKAWLKKCIGKLSPLDKSGKGDNILS